MTNNIERLVGVSTACLSEATPRLSGACSELAGALGPQLLQLLWARNGFYAFESALHVRALSDRQGEFGIAEWNHSFLWRDAYGQLADNSLFFAEDVFGGQFCITRDRVHRFDPETGDLHEIAATIEQWAGLILRDSDVQTGWPIARDWQEQNGALPPGKRLVPKTPFVLGGDFAIHNLAAIEDVRAMRFYGELATQIHDAADGAKIQLRLRE